MKKTKSQQGSVAIVIIGIISLLAIGAGAGYYFIGKSNKNVTEQIIPQTQQMGVIEDEAADWKTYNNVRYGYTIRYPANWFVDTTHSENDFTQRGPVEDNEFIGGDTGFSNYQNVSNYDMENPAPGDLYSVGLLIYKIAPDITYDQFISSKYFGYDKKEGVDTDSININGINAIRFTEITTDHPVGVTVVTALVKTGNKIFVFNYGGNPIPQQVKDIANNIINSFTVK